MYLKINVNSNDAINVELNEMGLRVLNSLGAKYIC